MKRTLFDDISDLIATEHRFSPDYILSIKSSKEYEECSEAERGFIDDLFNDYCQSPETEQ